MPRMDKPDTLKEDALCGTLPHVYVGYPGRAIFVGIDQQIPDLILVHLNKVNLPTKQTAIQYCLQEA